MLGLVGLLAGLALLIWLALRGVNVIFASVICSLVVMVTNSLPIAGSLRNAYTFGDLGAFTFAGRFFLLFAAGAAFGRIMGDSHAATSIAMALVSWLGAHRALWITVLACAMLTYGGAIMFGLGMWYLERQRLWAHAAGERFVPGAADRIPDLATIDKELPHCGAVIAMLTITQLTHREAYKDVGVVTVVIPVIATLAATAAALLF